MALYKSNLGVLFLTILVALTPPSLLVRPFFSGTTGLIIYFMALWFFGYIAYSATSIAISDICTGNKPSVLRSYRYVFGKTFVQLVAVNLLMVVLSSIGSVLFIVPGLLISAWYMLSPVVVVLEKTGPIVAMRRSRLLSKGFYARNLGLAWLAMFTVIFASAVVGGIEGVAILILKLQYAAKIIEGMTNLLVTGLLMPYVYTLMVLMYYDLRARREAYDSTALTEDLQR